MIKLILVILSSCLLVSFAPVPVRQPTVYWTRISIVQSQQQGDCTFETAQTKLSAQIEDPIGYPFGMVQAWSCTGDGLAVASELEARAADMHTQAAAYRAAHPIGGAK